jgi:DNA-binding NarL/FixJ family response regulator
MGNPIRVLLVDDHQMFADGLGLVLEAEADIHLFGVAGSAEEALALAQQDQPDIVLMDVDLPGLDGIEATLRFRQLFPDVRVVVMTALKWGDIVARAIAAGACGFVPKTRAADELVAVIRRAAAGEVVLPPEGVRWLVMARDDLLTGRAPNLTARELEVLQCFAESMSTAEVARTLHISTQTVQGHAQGILVKLGAHSRLEAVIRALRSGLIRLPP